MTIVFKYPGQAISGVASWAQVAVPYSYSKNLPDFMMFKVQDFQPPTGSEPGRSVAPGITKFPAYKVREVGGGLVVNDQPPTDPHSTIWIVSGVFPTYCPFGFPTIDSTYGNLATDASGAFLPTPNSSQYNMTTRPYIIPALSGLIGDLEYPTEQDLMELASLNLPVPSLQNITTYRIPKGSGSFIETPFQASKDYMMRYRVTVSDYVEAPNYPSTIAAQRVNLTSLVPSSLTDFNNINIEVIEESAVRKVLKVRAKRAFSGMHIFTYYYLYRNSDFIPFSTKVYYSDRLGARETHPNATGAYNPLMKRIHDVIGCAQAPMWMISYKQAAPNRAVDVEGSVANVPEILRDSLSVDNPSTEINPDTNEPFRFSYKFYGAYKVGIPSAWGPSTGAATTLIRTKVNFHKWLMEGAGTYWYGVIWNPGTVQNVFENEMHEYGLPEGTYIWAKGNC
jgi:hypothetical protein